MIVEIVEELVRPTGALYVQLLGGEILNTGLDTVWDNLRLYTLGTYLVTVTRTVLISMSYDSSPNIGVCTHIRQTQALHQP